MKKEILSNFLKGECVTELEFILQKLNIPANKDYKCWVAGGSVFKTISNIPLGESDIDIFFDCTDSVENFCKDVGFKQLLPKNKNETFFLKIENSEYKIQLIKYIYFKNPHDTIDNFDITVTQFATDGEFLYYTDRSMNDLLTKNIVINKITHQLSSFKRILKYTKLGLKMEDDQIKVFFGMEPTTPKKHRL